MKYTRLKIDEETAPADYFLIRMRLDPTQVWQCELPDGLEDEVLRYAIIGLINEAQEIYSLVDVALQFNKDVNEPLPVDLSELCMSLELAKSHAIHYIENYDEKDDFQRICSLIDIYVGRLQTLVSEAYPNYSLNISHAGVASGS